MEEQGLEITEEQEAEQLESGYMAARGDAFVETPEEKKSLGESVETQQEEAADQSPALFAGLTEQELVAQLAKANRVDELQVNFAEETRRLHSKFGELNRTLQGLSKGRTVTKESFKRISDEVSPEFAEALAEDLSSIPGGGAFDSTELEARINEAIAEKERVLTRGFEEKILTLKHPDWKQKKETPEYNLWFGTLPAEEQQQIKTSVDGLFAASALDKFDAWREERKPPENIKSKERLTRAITPRGAPSTGKPSTLTDEQGLWNGYNKANRSYL